MAFIIDNVSDKIETKRKESADFKNAWDTSREEYRLIGEMTSLRKQKKVTQAKLAALIGTKQQSLSRIEKHESIPTLRVFCNILDNLGYELKIVKKQTRRKTSIT